ncbi:hypothetical protein [Trichothermofontia sp.]
MVGAPLWRMLEGQTIQGQYHLEAFLGAGGYGGVLRATEVIRDRVIRQVAVKLLSIDDTAGLLYLHRSQPSRVHRDLTPGNIFWVGDRWKIGDFGLTRWLRTRQDWETVAAYSLFHSIEVMRIPVLNVFW